jgi:hypothetical protein
MNILCPNCQKPLTVPEQFAGQLMRCPMCAGTFTVPGLPAAPPPPAGPDTIPFHPSEAPPPPPPAPPPPAPPEPAKKDESILELPSAPTPAPSPPPPGDYTRTYSMWVSPKVLQFVAPAAMLLIFILTFFPWVGLYPGGIMAVRQSAWGAAFGSYTADDDIGPRWGKEGEPDEPGVSVMMIFYVLLLVPFLLLTVALLLPTFLPLKLPPNIANLLPWRWGVAAALQLILLFFLVLQLLFGFSLESKYIEKVNERYNKMQENIKKHDGGSKEKKGAEVARGEFMSYLERTTWLWLAFWLHVLALVCAALTLLLHQRERLGRPLPEVDLRV